MPPPPSHPPVPSSELSIQLNVDDPDIDATYATLERHYSNLTDEMEEIKELMDFYRDERDQRRQRQQRQRRLLQREIENVEKGRERECERERERERERETMGGGGDRDDTDDGRRKRFRRDEEKDNTYGDIDEEVASLLSMSRSRRRIEDDSITNNNTNNIHNNSNNNNITHRASCVSMDDITIDPIPMQREDRDLAENTVGGGVTNNNISSNNASDEGRMIEPIPMRTGASHHHRCDPIVGVEGEDINQIQMQPPQPIRQQQQQHSAPSQPHSNGGAMDDARDVQNEMEMEVGGKTESNGGDGGGARTNDLDLGDWRLDPYAVSWRVKNKKT